MKISDILFPDKNIADAEKLYFHMSDACICNSNEIIMPEDEVLSFDTYFNCIPVSQYLQYTLLENISAKLKIKGRFKAETIILSADTEKILYSTEIDGNNEYKEVFNLLVKNIELNAESILFIRITALEKNCVFLGGFYKTDAIIDNNIKIAVAACTYKREQYILKNIHNFKLNFDNSKFISYFIIDNAGTLDKNSLLGNNIHLISNRNLGGSGGFSRGIYEVIKNQNDYTHIILTDDDINIDWRCFDRLYAFLSLLKPEFLELCMGGGMFDIDNPSVQYEAGALCHNHQLCGIEMYLDMAERKNILKSLSAQKPDYCGWWCCCMPVSLLRRIDLPLPLFIKFDDVEYALRGKMQFIMPSGFCVWHENFEKKYQPALEYYISRNSLITYSLHDNILPLKTLIHNFITNICGLVFLQRYSTADVIMTAYEDFLKGAEFIRINDEEKYHKFIMSKVPQQMSIDEMLKKEKNICENNNFKHINRFKRYLTFNGIWTDKKQIPVLNIRQYDTDCCYGFKKTIQYNKGNNMGYITERNFRKILKSFLRMIKISVKMITNFRKAEKSYQNNLKTLSALNMWEKRFEKQLEE